jgi:hypothetical protein
VIDPRDREEGVERIPMACFVGGYCRARRDAVAGNRNAFGF